jgi:hypothetical protein
MTACPLCAPQLFDAAQAKAPDIKLCTFHRAHPLGKFFATSTHESPSVSDSDVLQCYSDILLALLEIQVAVGAARDAIVRQREKSPRPSAG